jgi:hypothetical protein
MKRITAIALLAIAIFAMAGMSFAQSTKGVQANVPFDFTVANKLLPAGTYTVKTGSGGLIAIKNHDKPITVLALTGPDSNKSENGGKLIFHKYGDQYFLSEILCDSENLNVAVPRSKTEAKVRLQQAMVHPVSEVFIAAR